MAVIIKGRLLTPEDPLICVPVMEKEFDDIIREAERLIDHGVPMLEWRLDAFFDCTSGEAVREVLEELKKKTRDVILLATLRSREQGGMIKISPLEKAIIYDEIAQSHCADMIDVEVSTFPDAFDLIKKLQGRGSIVLASYHDFLKTPSDESLAQTLASMKALDPDIVKLAVMPENPEDVDRLMAAAGAFHAENTELPLIAISMGALGERTRVDCGSMGGCVTFAAGSRASAPGQISYDELRRRFS